jgi:hypothetical protein
VLLYMHNNTTTVEEPAAVRLMKLIADSDSGAKTQAISVHF